MKERPKNVFSQVRQKQTQAQCEEKNAFSIFRQARLALPRVDNRFRSAFPELRVDRGFDFVVHDEHEGAADASEDVGERALEERPGAFLLVDFHERVSGAVVQFLPAAGHHEAAAHGVEGVGKDTSGVRGDLRDDEFRDNGRILRRRKERVSRDCDLCE